MTPERHDVIHSLYGGNSDLTNGVRHQTHFDSLEELSKSDASNGVGLATRNRMVTSGEGHFGFLSNGHLDIRPSWAYETPIVPSEFLNVTR